MKLENMKKFECVMVFALAIAVGMVVVALIRWRVCRAWAARACLDRDTVKLAKSISMRFAFYGSIVILFLGHESHSYGFAAPLAAAWLALGVYASYVLMERLKLLDRLASPV